MIPPEDISPSSVRILLINLNRYEQPYPVYPIGLATIEGALKTAGYGSCIWDSWSATDTLEQRIDRFQPHYVGISVRNIDNVQGHNPQSFVKELLDCCQRVRESTPAPLIIGGSAFSLFPHELFTLTKADYGIQGEAESAIVALLGALTKRSEVSGIPGVLYRDAQGDVVHLPQSMHKGDFSSRSHHDPAIMAAYLAKGGIPGIQTQRGCALKCCYCTYPVIEGVCVRYRPAEEVVEEMRRLAGMGVRYAFIVDSVFNTSIKHVTEVCEALARAEIDLQWECFLRPAGASRELLSLMHRAGMRHIEFGSDSFSDPVLQRYGKSFTFDHIESASRSAHALGLNYSHFLIFGGPGETTDTVEESLSRAQSLPGAFYFATIGMRIYPGTPLWSELSPESKGETPMDYLLEPRFFLGPGFTVQGLHERLKEVQRTCHNWVVGDPPSAFVDTMGKLRTRGIRGPMWEYIELLQRYSFPPREKQLPEDTTPS